MKKVKTNKLGRRILSFVLTVALMVGLMPGNILTVSAEGTDTVISDELIVESVSSNDASSATECTCGTDDPAFHATNCPAYIAPENPQCYCAEKCTEDTLNIWCDVCGVQGVSACQGEDTAVAYEIVANGTCGAEGNESSVTWSLDSDGTLTISGSGAMWDYSTANVGSKKRAPWYEHKDNITTVIIEEGVTTIGTYAFWSCEQLTEITISATVTTIGNSAFFLCEGLIQITIPQSVTSIGEFAFSGCRSLTSVTLPNSISTIQQNTFANCTSLTSITIPEGVTTIGPCAFCDCTSLNSITIPEGVTTIGDMAFYGCTSLETIVIPSSVTTIGANVFNEVPGVSSEDGFLIMNGILMKYTGDAANVEIPSGVTKINQRAFEDNQSIVTVKIPSGVTTLGSNAFFNCDSLVSVELPETLISMESSFIYCDGLKEITIPNGMETIGRSAFYECTSLEKVTIPNSVTEIGDDAFKNIANSATINAPCSWNENPLYSFADGITVNIPAHQNLTYSVNDEGNVINNECTNCGKVGGTLTINAEGGIYDGTTKYGATVEKTGTLENEEVTVNYYQGDTLIGTDAPINAGTYTAKITYEEVTASCQFEITEATPTADMFTYTSSAVYDGTEKSANVVVKDGITGIGAITNIKYYQNGTEVTPINAGTYTVKIDVAEGDNYDAATDIEVGTFEITKADAAITWDDQSVASTGEEAELTAPTITFAGTDKPEVELTYSYKVQGDAEYTTGLPTACGIYDVKVNVSATDNYNAVEDTMTLTITCTDADNNGICDHCGMYEAPERVDEYYHIANAGNLMWFAQQVNEGKTTINAKLTADIDMKDIDWTTMSSFAGTLDGNGHTILYLCADESDGDDDIDDGSRCGLFQTLSEGGTVTNLTISGAQLWSAHSAGAIAAVNYGTISKCIVKDSTIELGASHGLAAIAGTNTGTVTDCGAVNCFLQRRYSAANSNTFAIGVVVEDNSGTVSNCFSYGCTFSNSPNLYAIVESGNAPVNCYYYTDATVSDTAATSKTAEEFASGEVAYLLNGDQTTIVWGQTLTGENAQVYPVLNGDKVYRYESVKCDSSSKDPAVYGYSNEEKSDVIDEHNVDSNGFCTACGAYEKPETDENGVYQISNAGELYWFAEYVNAGNTSANAVLTADIVVNSGKVAECNGTKGAGWKDWTPISNISNRYTGTFEGNNKTISGLYFNNSEQKYVGLFGYIGSNAKIKNVGVVNSYYKGNNHVGGVCGKNYTGTITNCYNTGNVSATNEYADVGGVCGYNYEGTITNCYNTGSVTATGEEASVGGVCGENYEGTFTNCYYDNTVYTGNAVGGNYNGTLTSVEGKSTDQFASGEIAYLLNGSSSENVTWYQTLGTDAYPVFDSEHGTVYSVFKCNGTTQIYRNVNENEPHTDVNPVNSFCDECGANLHTHEWTYTASNNTITAVCGADGCPLNGAAKTIVISASDKIYDGTAVTATVTNNADTTDYSSSIVYKNSEGAGVDEAVNAGTYTANLTVGGVTASVEFTIAKKAITVTADDKSKTYGENDTALTYNVQGGLVQGETLEGALIREPGENAGTYAITQGTLTNENNPNYNITFDEGTFTINGIDISTATAEQSGTLTYDGTVQTPTFTVTLGNTTLTAEDYDVTVTAQTNAGSYTATISGKGNCEGTIPDVAWSISRATPIAEMFTYTAPTNLDYDGQVKEATVTTDKVGMGEITVRYSGNSVTAGTYTVTIDVEASTNYNAVSDLPVGEFTINKVDSVITAAPTPIADLVYGDTAYYLINAGTATGGTMLYSLEEDGEYSTSIPQGLNAGDYTIWYKVDGDENHNDTTPASIEVTIAPKTLEIDYITASDRAFDGTNTVEISAISIDGVIDADNVSASATATINSINAGVYSTVDLSGITLTGDDASNYSIVASAENVSLTTPVTISKAAAPTLPSGSKEYMYHQRFEGESVSITGLPTDCGEVSYYLESMSGDMLENILVDASNGKITYDVKALDSYTEDLARTIIRVEMDNYENASYALDVTRRDKYAVTVKDGMSVSLETNELIYGQMLGELAFKWVIFVGEAGEEVTGTLMWENSNEVPDVATDKASWRFIPDSDVYKEVVGTLDITVKQAPLVVEAVPVVADRVYNPSVKLADVALSGGTVKDEYGNTIEGTWSWEDSDIVPTVVNDGYEAVFTPADANYETVTGTITVTVAKATPDIGTVSASNMENTLDVSQVVLSRSNETVPGTLSLAEGTTLQYGTKDYAYVFTPNDNTDYETVTGTVSITISDTISPTATYKVGTDEWKSFINTITFGHFCKDHTTVDIIYSDEGSGVAYKQYYISDVEITNTANIQWSNYTDTLNINATGKYYIYVKVTDNYGNVVIQNSEGIVVYAESVITTTSFSREYGEENDLSVNISANGNTFAKLTDGSGNEIDTENYSIAGSTLTINGEYLSDLDVGEYTYKICMNPQGVENTEVTLAYSFVVKVTAKKLTVTGATAASRVYIANDETVNITGITLSGIQGTDDVSVSLTGVKGTLSSDNAGTYESLTLPALTLTGADKGNYELVQPTGPVTVWVSIEKLNAEIIVEESEHGKIFGQPPFSLGVSDNNPEAEVTYESNNEDVATVTSEGIVTIHKAGSAQITVFLAESTNYISADSKQIIVDVAKKYGYTVATIQRNYLYSRENADTIDLSAYLPADCGEVTYGTPAVMEGQIFSVAPTMNGSVLGYSVAAGEVSDAAQIKVTVKSENYADFTITVEPVLVEWLPVSPKTEVTLTNDTIIYGDALSEMSFEEVVFEDEAGNAVEGTLAWKEPSATPNAGTTSATWVFTPNNAEYASVEGTVAITVNKATPNVTGVPTVADRVYNPSVVLADSDLTGGTVKGVDGNSLAGSWSWKVSGTVPVVNNSGYEAVFTPVDANYETVTGTIRVKVNQATPVIAQVNGTTITYGDSLAASTVSGQAKHSDSVDMAVAGSFSWKDTTVKPAVADSDTTAFEVVFTPADSVNYKAVETTAKITVNKAPAAPNKPESSLNVPYTTDTVGETDLPAGWTWQNGETALEVGVVCNAVAVYTGTDAGNYETESVMVAITRAVCVHDGETELRDEAEESCTEDGYTGDTYCLICEEKLATGEAIPATGHKDADKNHVCDNGCNVAQGTCEDADKDHDCDYGCDKVFGTCEDADKDHDCDYGCSKVFGTCEDTDKDHDCDYGCDKVFGTCVDTDKDHACDYGCDKAFGTCEDTDKDHDCDYGCDKVFGTCEDTDKDHACDYGCDKAFGTCEDTDKDHDCDYGCDKVFGTCEDTDKDHDCDYGCDKAFGTCVDTDKDHDCDYGCDKAFGTCVDTDKDHDCDYGCDKAFGTHEAESGKHICEYCGKAATSCKDDNHDHVCDICGEELEHSFLTEWKYDEDGHWHVCSCGLKKDEATHSFTSQVTKQPTVHAEGERTYTCSECEYSYKEPIEKVKETPTPAPTQKPALPVATLAPTDPGKPFIQDDTGKIGWEVIRGETAKAKEGETIIVDMNGATSVPGAVFDDIKGKNITITLDMGTGVSWTINGKDITASKVNDINFEVKVGTKDNPINTIPVEVINKVTGERTFVNISLTHDGEFGLKAILNINLDKKNAGLFANLFYYDESNKTIQFICADDVDENGIAHMAFTHASEYIIVLDKAIMNNYVFCEQAPDTGDDSNVVWAMILMILSLSVAVGAVAGKKRYNS